VGLTELQREKSDHFLAENFDILVKELIFKIMMCIMKRATAAQQ